MLAPMALTSHARIFFSSIVGTVFLLFFVHEISAGMSEKDIALGLGLVMGLGGFGGVLGAGLAGRIGLRFGVGPTMIFMRFLETAAILLLVTAPIGLTGWAMAGAMQALAWHALGTSGPNEMGYRQAVTPDHLQARMNATIRSFNWGTVAIGAPFRRRARRTAGLPPHLVDKHRRNGRLRNSFLPVQLPPRPPWRPPARTDQHLMTVTVQVPWTEPDRSPVSRRSATRRLL